MRALCVTLIFLLALIARPKGLDGWQLWTWRAGVVIWAIWLQRKMLKDRP